MPVLCAFTLVVVLGIYLLVFGVISTVFGLSMGKENLTVSKTVS
jgi:uncharacterized membrane protein HdeD (DUF308 family)